MLGIFFLHQCRLAQQCVLDSIYNKCSRWWTFFISLFKKPAELSIDAIIGKWFNVHISSELTCQIRKKTVETHSSRSAPFSRHKNYVFKIVLTLDICMISTKNFVLNFSAIFLLSHCSNNNCSLLCVRVFSIVWSKKNDNST